MASTSVNQSKIENRNVFDEVVPHVTFPLPLEKTNYDVFINHRGPDVKYTLATAIYKALNTKEIRVFLDKELNLGEFFPKAIEEAIRSASVNVVIFSPGYAQSPWCLDELSLILESGNHIIPVFYHVEPSDLKGVTKGKGMYASAFIGYEEKGRYSLGKREKWKKALLDASFFKGTIIKNDNDEERFLKDIESNVLKILQKRKMVLLEVAKYPVGLEEAAENFKNTILKSKNVHPNVQIGAIWGMSGSGKTTLAKELYNQKYSFVKRSSFIDVKANKLHESQKQLLVNLGFTYDPFSNTDQGKQIISNCLRSVQVFIILDGVDNKDELDALLPAKDSLGKGSLIIITTQKREVVKHLGISCIYEMKKLNQTNAKQLFCWYAFSQPSPPSEFEEFVEKFVSACDGLPLSIKVLGSLLYGCSNKDIWDERLQKISKILPQDIKNILKVSYDALDNEEKQMFLDVACFFIGKDKMIAIAVWQGSEWSGWCGWEKLVNVCLVDVDNNNCIRMHDHLKCLGMEIAKDESPHRVCSPDQITCIQKQEEIRGMKIDVATNDAHNFPTFLLNTSICLCSFRRNRGPFPVGLKILMVEGNYQNSLHIAKLSRELLWLSWTDYPRRNLSMLSLKKLRVLELHNSQKLVYLWKVVEALLQLRVLSITDCPKLRKIPKSIVYLYHLKKIVLGGSNHLRKVDILPTAVEDIQVKDCKSLRNISGIVGVVNLQQLKLSNCPVLVELPSLHQLTSLKVFELTGDNKVEKIQGLQHCTSLEKLVLNCKCWEVPGIESLEHMQRLKRLQLVAKKRSAVEPCIQMIHMWPEEIIICTKAVADAGSLLNSSAFPNLSVLHSFANMKISDMSRVSLSSSNGNAMMLCLVINCLSSRMLLCIERDSNDRICETEVEEGKWILICGFTQDSRCLTAQNFCIHQGRIESHQTESISQGDEVEKGFLATGEEFSIREAFPGLLALGS